MSKQNCSTQILLHNLQEAQSLFGPGDRFLKLIEQQNWAQIHSRKQELLIYGHEQHVARLKQLFDILLHLIRKGYCLSDRDVQYAIRLAEELKADQLLNLFTEEVITTYRGRPVQMKTIGQKHYMTMMRERDIVFGIGPAGTGKTYLAVVFAIFAIKNSKVKKIIITRPAVEAGESLGFLPGDLQEKVDPYLRPLYDGLYDIIGAEQTMKMLERGLIEIAPLAYMRGRTLEDAVIILDEAQNTTPEQMKMFLTRLGQGSKMIITGDVTQIDLSRGKKSGLIEVQTVLRDVEEIAFVQFVEQDVVRHSLVQKVITAYECASKNEH